MQIMDPDVVDRLDQSAVILAEGVPWQHPWIHETLEMGVGSRFHAHPIAMAKKFRRTVFVMSDNTRCSSPIARMQNARTSFRLRAVRRQT